MRKSAEHKGCQDGTMQEKTPKETSSKSRTGHRPSVRAKKADATGKAQHSDAVVPEHSHHMRIAKAMARAGLCSRRDAERWVADGRVTVNGVKILSPAMNVGPADKVVVDGKPLPVCEEAKLWRYYKPRGQVTTHRDPQGRPTVFANLPPGLPRVLSIGRLDYNTEGLLLLTTDGGLARHLELPSTGWMRRYRVRAHGRVTQDELNKLQGGVEIDGVRYGPVEAVLDSMQGGNCWISIGLREGKNREVRNILASLGLQVNRLIRVSFGPFQLLDLKPGQVEPVKRRVLVDQLGSDMAAQFGLHAPSTIQPGKNQRAGRTHAPALRAKHKGKVRSKSNSVSSRSGKADRVQK